MMCWFYRRSTPGDRTCPSGVEFERWVPSGSRLLLTYRAANAIKRLPSKRWASAYLRKWLFASLQTYQPQRAV